MTNKTYDTLKILAIIVLPMAAFISALSNIWGWEYGTQVAATLEAFDIFVGAIVANASAKYNRQD